VQVGERATVLLGVFRMVSEVLQHGHPAQTLHTHVCTVGGEYARSGHSMRVRVFHDLRLIRHVSTGIKTPSQNGAITEVVDN